VAERDPISALLFPGQGVADELSRELVRAFKPDLLRRAVEALGDDPFENIRASTRYAQPAVYCAALAGYERLGRPRAAMLAGHSLGEIAALVAGGAIDEQDGLRIVVARGRLMADVAAQGEAGGMLALELPIADAWELARRHGLTVANENSPRQVVLSGAESGLVSAAGEARTRRLRAKRLRIAGPFHSGAMAPAVAPFRAVLADVGFREPSAMVYSGVTAAPFAADPRDELAAALVRPVRWVELLERLHAAGARRFIDVGPGRVLARLVQRTLEGVEIRPSAAAEVAHA
jgi:malonyl CoA-acyl carrier protein transacylase